MLLQEDDLLKFLKEQLRMLATSCIEFDKGNHYQAIDISHKLRVILHQTDNSHSLLHLLQKEDSSFLTTKQDKLSIKFESDPGSLLPQFYLVKDSLGNFRTFQAFFPHLDDYKEERYLTFEEWWKNEVICYHTNEYSFTRKTLVVNTFANKLGGSHVDPSVSRRHIDILRLDPKVIGWHSFDGNNNPQKPLDSPFLASVRQIAHELYKSLDRIYNGELELHQHYFAKIKSYKFIGHNRVNWAGGAIFNHKIIDIGDFYQAIVLQNDKDAWLGLSTFNHGDDYDYRNFDYCIYAKNNGKVIIFENGIPKTEELHYTPNDLFAIGLSEEDKKQEITYLHNNKIIYKSLVTPHLPLFTYMVLGYNSSIKEPKYIRGFKP